MNLTKELRNQSYDLIEGPVRNHRLKQVWIKKGLDEVDIYDQHIDKIFDSNIILNENINSALNVDYSKKDEYAFKIGMTVLEDILSSIGIGTLSLNTEIKSGKKVSISFENSQTVELNLNEIENYLHNADFKNPNRTLLRNINKDNWWCCKKYDRLICS